MISGKVTSSIPSSGSVSGKATVGGGLKAASTVFVCELRFDYKSQFPIVGDDNILYVATDENIFYRWDSVFAKYVKVGSEDVITNYEELENLPKLNGIPITGDKTNEQYGIEHITNLELEELLK